MEPVDSFRVSRETYDAQKARFIAALMEETRQVIEARNIKWPSGEVTFSIRSKFEFLHDFPDGVAMIPSVTFMLQDAFDADGQMRAFRVMEVDIEIGTFERVELCLVATCLCCIPSPLILVHLILNRMFGIEYGFRIKLEGKEVRGEVVGIPLSTSA